MDSKPGDEMGLTSVFLSSLRLITEFRKMVLSPAKMRHRESGVASRGIN